MKPRQFQENNVLGNNIPTLLRGFYSPFKLKSTIY